MWPTAIYLQGREGEGGGRGGEGREGEGGGSDKWGGEGRGQEAMGGRGGLLLPLLMGAEGSEEERRRQQREGVARLHIGERGSGKICGLRRAVAG